MKPYILVVDDEPDICASVKDILEDEGYAVAVAENGETARQLVRQKMPDMVLLDIWMPDIDGITLLKEFSGDLSMTAPVIMMSGHGNVETAVEATRSGAKDFIEKPLSLAKLLHTVEHTLAEAKQNAPSRPQHTPLQAVPPVGKSVQIQLLREQLEKLAHHSETVLLCGEPGSGKTFCGKYIHARSARQNGPFIDVHTRMFHDGHADVLLFGKESGDSIQPGFLEQAQGGTLFLNDVAELSLDMQQSLFAVLSTGSWVRINGSQPLSLDACIITATRYDLEQEIRAGRFREDLFHLLNVVPLHVPALREHVEDVSELLVHYVNLLVDKEGLPYRNFTVAAQNRLRHYQWPGNIRELEGLVRRQLVMGLETDIELEEVEAVLDPGEQIFGGMESANFDLPLRQAREKFEKAYLEYHLQQAGGRVGKVAKLVGMERTNLYRKLRALGVDTGRAGR
jgi:two-component system, NtrC family, nitrogen regulation response regulator NtrX